MKSTWRWKYCNNLSYIMWLYNTTVNINSWPMYLCYYLTHYSLLLLWNAIMSIALYLKHKHRRYTISRGHVCTRWLSNIIVVLTFTKYSYIFTTVYRMSGYFLVIYCNDVWPIFLERGIVLIVKRQYEPTKLYHQTLHYKGIHVSQWLTMCMLFELRRYQDIW